MSAATLVEALEQLVVDVEVEAPADCDRCDSLLGDHYARLGFTPIGQSVDAVDIHVCEDCSEDVQSLLEEWVPYDRRYLQGIAFGTESRQGTDCSSCHSPIERNPTIVAFEEVGPGGFETQFAGDFLTCEHCREDLVQQLTQSNS